MADGQAEQAPETLSDLADFLADNPMDQPREKKADTASTDTASDDDTPDDDATPAPAEGDQDDDQEGDDDADQDDDQEAEPDKQTSERKLKVTVKGDDGADQTLELPESEVVKGYMRQADYSRKTEDLARQSHEAFQTYTTAIEQRGNQYLENTQKQLMAIHALAGLRTPEEMAVLAQNDPATWIQEQQRERAISQVVSQINANMAHEKQQLEQQRNEALKQTLSHAWGVLGQAGFDKPKLKALFDTIKDHYGIPQERFDNINDPKLVFIMRDAAAYRALQAKKAQVTQKAKEAPRLPPPRQSTPQQAKLSRRINDRFKGGNAKVEDLAAYLAINKI